MEVESKKNYQMIQAHLIRTYKYSDGKVEWLVCFYPKYATATLRLGLSASKLPLRKRHTKKFTLYTLICYSGSLGCVCTAWMANMKGRRLSCTKIG